MSAILSRVNTNMPGRITKWEPKLKRASVQPLIQDNAGATLPICTNVPVIFLSGAGGKAIFSLPVEVGDGCLLLYSQRSLDNWLSSGDISRPGAKWRFSETDGLAIVGLESFSNPIPAHPTDVMIRFDKMEVRLQPGNKIAIGVGGVELLDLLDQTLSALLQSTTATMLGAQPLSKVLDGTFATIKTKLGQIKGKL